jgi:hypothetical protein
MSISIQRVAIASVSLGLLLAEGCAPLAQRWAERGTEKAIAEAAADDCFPSAAEAGLAAAEPSAD